MNQRTLRTYALKEFLPSWHFDPATIRQLKVLRFFGIPIDPPPTKGSASGTVCRLFSDPANKHLWNAYVYTTNDTEDSSSELRPHDQAALTQVSIPDDWQPHPRSTLRNDKRKALEKLVGDLLKEGSPFEDPLPELAIVGKCFCFTGRFEFGSRSECRQAVVSRGGSFTDGLTGETDVLVIGSDANPAWANGNYGIKIEAAMVKRMAFGKPVVIPESYWKELITGERAFDSASG